MFYLLADKNQIKNRTPLSPDVHNLQTSQIKNSKNIIEILTIPSYFKSTELLYLDCALSHKVNLWIKLVPVVQSWNFPTFAETYWNFPTFVYPINVIDWLYYAADVTNMKKWNA